MSEAFMKFVYFLGFIVVGFIVLSYNRWLVDHTTRIDFFEQNLGSGGTYTFVKLVGVFLIAVSFYILVNGVPF